VNARNHSTDTALTAPQQAAPVKKWQIIKQRANGPFCPNLIAIVPADNEHGDAIAHIPLMDGQNFTAIDDLRAGTVLQALNTHAGLVAEVARLREALEEMVNHYEATFNVGKVGKLRAVTAQQPVVIQARAALAAGGDGKEGK